MSAGVRLLLWSQQAALWPRSPWHTLLTCPIFDMRMLVYFPRRNCQAKTLWSNAMLSSLHQCHLQVETRGIHASGRAGNLTAADAPHSCHTCVRSRKGTVSTQEG
ncbi:uncharacterized protein C8Q71DRAFT_382973 [Rhodofomes roseus]|uniref:Secreted protein n=1 Tax=Rhodofomes roseus TaxID=34475 RepID=A0ABQ8K1C9_9APHY|nr:uncharacterized protein C8Q71DRAFT_382973 [Rhodofomes roseus]KAH9830218.1 hypothetical protein C8Q71DRAFT_382973 [Rhodofomes roseus]